MCGVLLHHMQRLNHKHHTKPFINIDQHEIVTRLGKKIAKNCHRRNEEGSRVVFTAGIDGTSIVKSYKVYFSHAVVVGGAYTNNYFPIDDVKGEGLKLSFQEYLDGLHGQLT